MEEQYSYINLKGDRVYLPCPKHSQGSFGDCFYCKEESGYFDNLPGHIYEQSIPIPQPPGWYRNRTYGGEICERHGDWKHDCYHCHQELGNLEKLPEHIREYIRKDSELVIRLWRRSNPSPVVDVSIDDV